MVQLKLLETGYTIQDYRTDYHFITRSLDGKWPKPKSLSKEISINTNCLSGGCEIKHEVKLPSGVYNLWYHECCHCKTLLPVYFCFHANRARTHQALCKSCSKGHKEDDCEYCQIAPMHKEKDMPKDGKARLTNRALSDGYYMGVLNKEDGTCKCCAFPIRQGEKFVGRGRGKTFLILSLICAKERGLLEE